MKSYLLTVGSFGSRLLSTLMNVTVSGTAASFPEAVVLHIGDEPLPESTLDFSEDLNLVRGQFGDACPGPYFATGFSISSWRTELPNRQELTASDPQSDLLLTALRGRGRDGGFGNDAGTTGLAMSALLSDTDHLPGAFQAFFGGIRETLDAGEHVRVALVCDLAAQADAGLAAAVAVALRTLCPGDGLTIAFALTFEDVNAIRDGHNDIPQEILKDWIARRLIRVSDNRPTRGADAAYLVSLPAGLVSGENAFALSRFELARAVCGFFAGEREPSAGLHLCFVPAVYTWKALGSRGTDTAVFLTSAVWALTDLLPAMQDNINRPSILRSITPVSRGALFRRLLRNTRDDALTDTAPLTRVLETVLHGWYTLICGMPDLLRDAEKTVADWNTAVAVCGKAVTLGAAYDTLKAKAEATGLDKVEPVHRVSMTDTEEEAARRRIDDAGSELNQVLAERKAVFDKSGAVIARLALEDCLRKCEKALSSAREKLSRAAGDTADSKDEYWRLEERVIRLKAAVARAREDLTRFCVFPGLAAIPSPRISLKEPYSGQLLAPEAVSALGEIADHPGDPDSFRALRDGLPGLIAGRTGSDGKQLLKNLLGACVETGNPAADLINGIIKVIREDFRLSPFAQTLSLPDITLGPDLTPGEIYPLLSALPGRLITDSPADDTAGIRGVLAMLLLRQYRKTGWADASLSVVAIRPDQSVLNSVWLDSVDAKRGWIVSLTDGTARWPFAVVLPGRRLIPAKLSARHAALIPAWVTWFDPALLTFRDPCHHLCEQDRLLLTQQLTRLRTLLSDPAAKPFADLLSQFHRDITVAGKQNADESDPLLRLRLTAAFGLLPLNAYSDLTRTVNEYDRALTQDRLCACLADKPAVEPPAFTFEDEIIYARGDRPFARESRIHLLESTNHHDEKEILESLKSDCERLFDASDDYRDTLQRELTALLARYPDAREEDTETATRLLNGAAEPLPAETAELTAPWDPADPAILTIVNECVGAENSAVFLSPFTDKLAVIPRQGGQILGDRLMSAMCRVSAVQGENPDTSIPDDAVLPPVLPAAMDQLCALGLMREGTLSFTRVAEGIRACLTVFGRFELRLYRVYTDTELLLMYAKDIPTVAVWPSVPFAENDWHAYFVYAKLPEGYDIASPGTVHTVTDNRHILRSAKFPKYLCLSKDGAVAASLPHLLPAPDLPAAGNITACVDFGTSASAVVFTGPEGTGPLSGGTLVRTLLHHPSASADLLRREFIPQLPFSALLPSTVCIFRNEANAQPVPFADGIILMPSGMDDLAAMNDLRVYTSLTWDPDKSRAASLYLHQLMLMTALQARMRGASTLTWRFSVPDAMTDSARAGLCKRITQLAQTVSEESGLPGAAFLPQVAFLSGSDALGAYFRFCAPEEVRGTFLTMDIGSDTADFSFFLRGSDAAAVTVHLPLGIHYMLLPFLLGEPLLPERDLQAAASPALREALHTLKRSVTDARTDPSGFRCARLALDTFIADHGNEAAGIMFNSICAGVPTCCGALLLLYLSFLFTISGLITKQIADDPRVNDLLPNSMPVCLAGRGGKLLDLVPDSERAALWRFQSLVRNDRVNAPFLLRSAEPKLELAVGLSTVESPSALVPSGPRMNSFLPVDPAALLINFLILYQREFPAEAQLLFPGWFVDDPRAPLTTPAENAVHSAVAGAFGNGNDVYDCLADSFATLAEQIDLHKRGEHPWNA